MFRIAELGRSVSKEEYNAAEPVLRAELLEAQQSLRGASFPVIIVFGGVDGAGKSETINVLNSWMDPRWLVTRAYGMPSDEMADRPEYWRYWRDLPPRGRIGLFSSCWYSTPLLDRAFGRASEAEFDEALDRVIQFEKCLADDGALIIKFWMHLGREAQKTRLKALEKNPLTAWRVTETDWRHWRMYDQFVAAAERVIMRTSTGQAPWHIVEGLDKRYRSLAVGSFLLEGIRKHIDSHTVRTRIREALNGGESPAAPATAAEKPASAALGEVLRLPQVSVLSKLDMTTAMDKKDYAKRLEEVQGTVNRNFRKAKELGISTVLVFEGWDAAGKGGAIRRVTAALDARDYQVIPIASPTDEERAHHYLWRFWRHLSRRGRLTIFDRSWYGRVLVERVEGFAGEDEWRRAYAEINDFEDQLIGHGIVLGKFWIHITKEEQLARFQERENSPHKSWKMTEEDWRNREKWDDYERAINDMIEHTSTTRAPWSLIAGNDKRRARIEVLSIIGDAIGAAVERATANADKPKKSKKVKSVG